jgi:hypothetical protein
MIGPRRWTAQSQSVGSATVSLNAWNNHGLCGTAVSKLHLPKMALVSPLWDYC